MASDERDLGERDTVPAKGQPLLTEAQQQTIKARAANYMHQLGLIQNSRPPSHMDNLALTFALCCHAESIREATIRLYGKKWLDAIDALLAPHIEEMKKIV